MSKLLTGLLLFLAALFLGLAVRGLPGNPSLNDLSQREWRDDGPFELSPERGRFGLTYALIEEKSVYFSTALARFIVPDLGYKNGRYVSLFAPAFSFIVSPGYLVGKWLGAAQVGAFAVVSLFALMNLYLTSRIAQKLGAAKPAAWLGGWVFLFASPAYAYAVDLYQHHLSTFLILASLLILISTKKIWPLLLVFFLAAAAVPLDYPNLVLMLPIGLAAAGRLVNIKYTGREYKISLSLRRFLVVAGALPPLFFLVWFNLVSYGNPFQLAGTVGGVRGIDEFGQPAAVEYFDPQKAVKFVAPEQQRKSALAFFNSRQMLTGFYVHFFGPDRSLLLFTPVMFLGVFGLWRLYQEKNKYLALMAAVLGLNIVLYAMWGDPWGGWAFGARYLIPGYAILSIFLAVALTYFRRRLLFIIPFYLLAVYSLSVNSLGAVTTSAILPREEALALAAVSGKKEGYFYDRSWQYLSHGRVKAFIFNAAANKYLSAKEYYYVVAAGLIGLTGILTVLNYAANPKNS